jgi:hypothetical protein
MIRYRTAAEIDADLIALRAAAERAGTALACVFSPADEDEARIIQASRAQGLHGARFPQGRATTHVLMTLLLALAFLML